MHFAHVFEALPDVLDEPVFKNISVRPFQKYFLIPYQNQFVRHIQYLLFL